MMTFKEFLKKNPIKPNTSRKKLSSVKTEARNAFLSRVKALRGKRASIATS